MIKKIFLKFITFVFIISFSNTICANISTSSTTEIWPYYNGEISSEAAIVIDADSSKVLYEYNADKRMYPASLTKLMTAIIVLEKARGNYDDLVTFSYNAVTKDIDRNSVTIGASAGDQLSIKDCLYSLLLPSANDAANALAEHYAGSINDFALLMNEKAENLGLKNTHFVNPSGLHDDNQYTTASDMAKILQYAMSYPIFLQISSSVSYRHAPIRKYKNPENSNNQVLNTNSIMVPGSGYYYNGITSGKTGHTSLAGYNLASSAKKNNMHLICITLNGKSEKQRFNDAKNLYDFHFDNYKSLSIINTDPRFLDKKNTLSINDVNLIKSLDITCNENAHITLPKNVNFDQVKSKLVYQVKDIYNKYAIGYITYAYDNTFVGECTLEGRDTNSNVPIHTGHLDINKVQNDEPVLSNDNNKNKNDNTNALIYKNSNGKLVISKTLTTFISLLIAFILITLICMFIYTRVLLNANFPLNKFLFKIRRFFRK